MKTIYKELPMAEHRMCSLPATINLYEVLCTHKEGIIWFVENHLNLISFFTKDQYTHNGHNFWIDFSTYDPFYVGRIWEECWMIRKKTHIREYINLKWNSFIDFCIDSITRGYYIFVTINTEYINAYGKDWIDRHQLFIHGFDCREKKLYCSDFFGYPSKYSRKWIPFNEIELAFHSLYRVSDIDDFEGVCLWMYKPETYSFDIDYGCRHLMSIDYQYVIHQLRLYLDGLNERSEVGNGIKSYGKNIFKSLIEYMNYEVETVRQVELQPYYVVLDHITVLSMLIEILLCSSHESLDCMALKGLINEANGLKRFWKLIINEIIKDSIKFGTKGESYIAQRNFASIECNITHFVEAQCNLVYHILEYMQGNYLMR